jgi:hypothetical protein
MYLYSLQIKGDSNKKKCRRKKDQQQQYITDPSSRQRWRYKITNPQLSKENLKEKGKLVAGPRWTPDTKTDWPTDCRSLCDFDFDLDRLCGLVDRVPGYVSRGPGSISGATRLSEK